MNFKNIFYLLVSVLVISCTNDEVTSDLQSQIDRLESTIETLQGTIQTLQTNVGAATTANSALSDQLSDAQAAIQAAQNLISSNGNNVTSNQTAISSATSDINGLDSQISALLTRLAFLQEALEGVSYNQAVNLEATGTLSEQTPSQARQTIYGRWDIGGSGAAKSASADRNGCSFEFIEFLDDSYLLVIALPEDEVGVLFGDYVLNENADGDVTSVDLMFDAGDITARVARLTNVVVTETAGELSASFDVELTLPEDIQTCQTSLPGSVTAPKEEPVDEALTANAVSNHALLIGEWSLKDYQSSDGENLQTILTANCIDYDESTGEESIDPNCEAAGSAIVNFSDFGTYSISILAQNGQPLDVEIGGWYWEDDQNTFVVFDEEDEDDSAFDVVSLNENEFIISGSHFNYDIVLGDSNVPEYSGVFGNVGYGADENGNHTFNFPSSAESWGGFANQNAAIYPMSFPYGGKISFTGSAPTSDVELFFKFERAPFPEVDPAFETPIAVVSGADLTSYSVEIPPQDPSNTFSSALFYLITRDTDVIISNFSIQAYTEVEERVTETFTFSKY